MHHASPATYLAIEEPLELDAESVRAEKTFFDVIFLSEVSLEVQKK